MENTDHTTCETSMSESLGTWVTVTKLGGTELIMALNLMFFFLVSVESNVQ